MTTVARGSTQPPPPGIGGVAYATRGVLEIGGQVGLVAGHRYVDFAIAPSLGWFVIDNFELTLLAPIEVTRRFGDNVWNVGITVEPSYHVPFSNQVFGFFGLGLGFTYAQDVKADGLVRPVIGTDVMVGRSGIFKPELFVSLAVRNLAFQGGVAASFTVML